VRALLAEPAQIRLVPVDDRAGISFQHELGEGGLHIAESPGSGGAWIDYDVDGDLDLILVNGLPARDSARAGEMRQRAAELRRAPEAGPQHPTPHSRARARQPSTS